MNISKGVVQAVNVVRKVKDAALNEGSDAVNGFIGNENYKPKGEGSIYSMAQGAGQMPDMPVPLAAGIASAIGKGSVASRWAVKAPIELLVSHEGAPDLARVAYYKNKILQGGKIDPLKIINEGAKYGIEDGKHRFEALKQLGFKDIPVEFMRRKN